MLNIIPLTVNDLWEYVLFLHGIVITKKYDGEVDINLYNLLYNQIREQKHYSFYELTKLFAKRGIKKINSKRALSILKFIDEYIYDFDEYNDLFTKPQVKRFANNNYELNIRPQDFISKRISQSIKGGLRSYVEPSYNSISTLNHIRHFVFSLIHKDFECYTSYIESKGIRDNIEKNSLNIYFLHMISCVDFNNFKTFPYNTIVEVIKGQYFTIKYNNKNNPNSYEKDYQKWYLETLTNSLKNASKGSFILIPEITTPNISISKIEKIIKNNSKSDCLIVAGSNWRDNKSTVRVFDSQGKLILEQCKHAPFKSPGPNNSYIIEDLHNDAPLSVNLLNVKSVGLFAFVVCSDILDRNYINQIISLGITNLIMVSLSYSKDVFTHLETLAKDYLVVSFACNVCFDKDKDCDGFVYLPFKNNSTRCFRLEVARRSCLKECEKREADCKSVCPGSCVTYKL